MRYNTQKRAKKTGHKVIPHGFEKAYYELRVDHMDEVKSELMVTLGWSVTRFYNRMRGLYAFSPEEIKAIEMIFQKYGIHAWDGSRLFNTAEYEPEEAIK